MSINLETTSASEELANYDENIDKDSEKNLDDEPIDGD